jgi:PTS system cellobiose-specific IIA component
MALSEKLEDIAMNIIANAGAARTAAFEALAKAKEHNYEKARELLESSDDYAHKAHAMHGELLALYAKGEVEQSDILLAHAQDHLMCAVLAKELIAEIIELRISIEGR